MLVFVVPTNCVALFFIVYSAQCTVPSQTAKNVPIIHLRGVPLVRAFHCTSLNAMEKGLMADADVGETRFGFPREFPRNSRGPTAPRKGKFATKTKM